MREILFRGKNVDTGEWVYGSFIPDLLEIYQNGPDGWLGDWGFIKPFARTKEERLMVQVDRDTVGQYTGLTDKNGRRIFEGDIVKSGCRMIVTWDEKFASWSLTRKSWPFKRFFGEAVSPDCCEIIGNRWDNPELLEEARDRDD